MKILEGEPATISNFLALVGIKVIPIAFRSAFQMYTGSVEFADDVIEKID